MRALLKKLSIDEKFTKPIVNKQKVFNHIKNNIPKLEDYNFSADILELPQTKNNYRYLLVVVDLATDEFDIEPLKTKESSETLNGFKTMFKRKHIKKPYASLRTDNGKEFQGVFHKWLLENEILHKTALKNKHSQMANVESLNKQLARLFNGYMNYKEIQTGKIYKEWDDVIDIIRTDLNKHRKKKVKSVFSFDDYPVFIEPVHQPKYKVGSVVHNKLYWPENALGNPQPTGNFRVGDYRYSNVPKKIVKLLYFNDFPFYRYILEGMPGVSFSEYELIPSKYKQTKYKVKKIIDYRMRGNKREFKIWWLGYLKKNATWEKEKTLREDGLGPEVNEFMANL